MKVFIDKSVHASIEEFYDIALWGILRWMSRL